MFSTSRHFLCLTILLSVNQLVRAGSKNCFRAAVYEHVQITSPIEDPLQVLNNNLEVYSNVLKVSSYENVNLLVFPENGLTPSFDKDTVLSAGLAAIAPEVGKNPCKLYNQKRKNITHGDLDDDAKDELLADLNKETEELGDGVVSNVAILRKLSCLAKKYKTHVAVDLSELEVTDKPAEESTTTAQSTTETQTTKAQSETEAPATTTTTSSPTTASEQTAVDSTTASDNIEDQTDSTGQPTKSAVTDSTAIAAETTAAKSEESTTFKSSTTTESATTEATSAATTAAPTTSAASTTTVASTTTAESTTASPQKVYSLYNTAFVFDDKGKLVAKYRKFNLFGESQVYTRPEKPELVTFNNKYGKFGLAICADLLWEHPVKDLVEQEKIEHLIFPTSWFDALPPLAAVNYHSAAAIKYGINVLAANKRNLSRGAFGSGIYTGDGVKVQTPFSNERLLIAELPIGLSKRKKVKLEDWECKHTDKIHIKAKFYNGLDDALADNKDIDDYKQKFAIPFDSYKTKQLKGKQGSIKDLCEGETCCDVQWRRSSSNSDDFYLAVSNQVRKSQDPNSNWAEESCLLFNYDTDEKQYKLSSSTRFSKLELKGRFNTTDVFPNVVSSKLALTPKRYWDFKQSNGEAQISLKKSYKPVNFVTLYARNFAEDPASS